MYNFTATYLQKCAKEAKKLQVKNQINLMTNAEC